MQRLTWCFAAIGILLAVSIGLAATEKSARDTRLDQLVTIESTDKRLHSVLEEISGKTGVAIQCGRNKADWQVRDIPVVVCVKDVPLARVLQAVAKSTHLTLSSYQIGDVKTYRIWRDPKRERELADYEDQKRKARGAIARWEWDEIARLKDMPRSAWPADWPEEELHDPMAKDESRLLATLGPTVRDGVLSSGRMEFTVNESPPALKTVISRFLYAAAQKARDNSSSGNAADRSPSVDDIASSKIIIESTAGDSDNTEGFIHVHCEGPIPLSGAGFLLDLLQNEMSPEHSSLPGMPLAPGIAEPDWSSPFWQTKVRLERPKQKDIVSFADALAALSKATGYAVVYEDFHSHKTVHSADPAFGSDTTIRQVVSINPGAASWSVDEANKLLRGSDRDWPTLHSALVPESLINGLRDKLDAEGVELDDVTPLARLSERQVVEWLAQTADLTGLADRFDYADKPLWLFYDSLSAADKARAKSDSGLPVGELDRHELIDILEQRNEKSRSRSATVGSVGSSEEPSEIPTDPETVSSMVLRIRRQDARLPGRHYYRMEIGDQRDREKVHLRIPGPAVTFPKYSPRQEAELRKKDSQK